VGKQTGLSLILSAIFLGLVFPALAIGAQEGNMPASPMNAIRVNANQSSLLDTDVNIKRVSVAKPEIADVLVISPRQFLIVGKTQGTTSLVYWNENEVPTNVEVIVGINVERVREDLQKIAPDETFELTASGGALILTGTVSSKLVENRLVESAKVYAQTVVDLLKVVKLEQVLIQVRVAEVDRTLAKELGLKMLLQPVINGGQYRFLVSPPGGFDAITGSASGNLDVSISDLTNLFLVTPGEVPKFAAILRAMEDKGAIKILSEPNLVVANGDEGKFLVGGEFPVVIASAAGSGAAASVSYKEYGIRVGFNPRIVQNGDIYMKIFQEVSELDFANGVAVSGFQLPALKSRKAESGLQLADGQTFVLAGLIDKTISRKVTKIPILGDIPILGVLFRNTRYSELETELMLMITPKIVRPLNREEIPILPTETMKPEETSPSLWP
jgi:pilus assembly protein CpaC